MISLPLSLKQTPYVDYKTSVMPLKIPYLKLATEVPVELIYREWEAVKHLAVLHRDHGYESHRDWYGLCLHGLGATMTEDYTQYGYKRGDPPKHSWTEIADLCPETVSWIKSQFPSDNYYRIRFMLLKAGGYIAPHTDSTKFILAPINISITHPTDCEMIWTKFGKQPWLPGQVYLMNLSYEHEVLNKSTEDRLHIIIDPTDFGTQFEELVKKTVYVL